MSLMAVILLSALGVGLITMTQTGALTAYNYKTALQAEYLAEAGAQAAINWFSREYEPIAGALDASSYPVKWNASPVKLAAIAGESSNFPVTATITSFSSSFRERSLGVPDVRGTYSVSATMQSKTAEEEVWEIRSQGTISGYADGLAEARAVVRVRSPMFRHAVLATGATCASIDFSSSSATDSWNSNNGTYLQTKQASGGDVASNGAVKLSGSSAIWGTAFVPSPSASSCSQGYGVFNGSSVGVQGGIQSLSPPAAPPNPVSVSPGNQDFSFGSGGGSIPPGVYRDLTVSGGGVVDVSPGEYVFNSIRLSGGSSLRIQPAGRTVIRIAGVNVSKAMDLSGGSFSNPSGVPLDLQIYYGGAQEMVLSGGSGSYGVVYAPNAPTTISGGGDWYGAMVVKTLKNSGGSKIHFDKALSESSSQKISVLSMSHRRS